MKHIILLRHAKSSWVNPELDDFDRPLNKRGKRSANVLGDWLRTEGWDPDQILCSAARRTRETCDGLKLNRAPDLSDDLYHASSDTLFRALRQATGETVLLISHNPGIAALAHMLVDTPPAHPRFDDYPTGALLVAQVDVESLADLRPHSGQVVSFLTPHDLVSREP